VLTLDFTAFVPTAGEMVFDLIRSATGSGILGDFGVLELLGLAPGFSAVAGVEVDDVAIYRVRLAAVSVPEPGTLSLMLSALFLLVVLRRRQASA
jgi:hypothetical protein